MDPQHNENSGNSARSRQLIPKVADDSKLNKDDKAAQDALIGSCELEHGSKPEYKDAVKLKVINHGNCDFCEVSIQKVYNC